jgi:hypothetical protein
MFIINAINVVVEIMKYGGATARAAVLLWTFKGGYGRMSEQYISKAVLTEAVYISMHDNPHKNGVRRACHNNEHMHFSHMIYHTPAADVMPVVHARWIFSNTLGHEWMKCSNCLKSQTPTGVFTYCPNCGAIMDEGDV